MRQKTMGDYGCRFNPALYLIQGVVSIFVSFIFFLFINIKKEKKTSQAAQVGNQCFKTKQP